MGVWWESLCVELGQECAVGAESEDSVGVSDLFGFKGEITEREKRGKVWCRR
jgi:hypothetical protein